MLTSKAGKKKKTNNNRFRPAVGEPACFSRQKRPGADTIIGRPGFTLIEIVVSLLIISSSLLFLLVTIRRGLTLLETSNSELRFYLESVTRSAGFFSGGGEPEKNDWETKSFYLRPKLQVTELKNKNRSIWVSKLEKEDTASP